MPQNNRATTTKAVNTLTGSLFSTQRAVLFSPIREILVVNFAVALFAQGLSVRNIKTKISAICPWLDMMGMNFAIIPATATREIIAAVNSIAPFFYWIAKPSAVTFKRFPILPSWSIYSALVGLGAFMRTVFFPLIECIKRRSAMRAYFNIRVSALCPARLTAIFRCFCAEHMLPVNLAAYCANEVNALSAFINWFSFNSWHGYNIYTTHQKVKRFPVYCDVIVKRWETLTGKKAELEK